MNIELKNVKYAEFASEETSCFSATVYIDGKREGEVSNDGHGGCHMWHPWQLQERVEAYAKTLPEEKTDMVVNGEPFIYQPNADGVIDKLLEAFLLSRDLKRALSSHILFMRDGKVYETKRVKAAQIAVWLQPAMQAATKAKLNAETILNLLPFAEALDLYRKHGA